MKATTSTTRNINITGPVQGTGIRPAIARLATQLKLQGFVQNTSIGVRVIAQGPTDVVEKFLEAVNLALPKQANVNVENVAHQQLEQECFQILASEANANNASPALVPDHAPCVHCRKEFTDPKNRRFAYPFTNCAQCGPRYSIHRGGPFDRGVTSMKSFELCAECQHEYDDSASRRYHAQTISCPACGPKLFYAAHECSRQLPQNAAIQVLQRGGVLLLQGVGGYQLVCMANKSEAIERIRIIKQRPEKPFAILCDSLERTETIAVLNDEERAALRSAEAPIVLLPSRSHASVHDSVAPNLSTLGIMLPASPLHFLLAEAVDAPLLVTSANRKGEPIEYQHETALEIFADQIDGVLYSDRVIENPLDDSVVQVVEGRMQTLRRARGFVPNVFHSSTSDQTIIALGGFLKNTNTLAWQNQYLMSPYWGDADAVKVQQRANAWVAKQLDAFRLNASALVQDQHPDLVLQQNPTIADTPVKTVQHHVAHMAALMLEHSIDEPCLTFVFDGMGFGTDNTLWGGECFYGDWREIKRVACLKPFQIIGGDMAHREPARLVLSLCADRDTSLTFHAKAFLGEERATQIQGAIRASMGIQTSSVGRLFDVMASVLDVCQTQSYEGQAAMLVQQLAEQGNDETPLPFIWDQSNGIQQLDLHDMWLAIEQLLKENTPSETIARRFHATLVAAMLELTERLAENRVLVSGGCFQNSLLLSLMIRQFEHVGKEVLFPQQFPCNDGGISLGQAAILQRGTSLCV